VEEDAKTFVNASGEIPMFGEHGSASIVVDASSEVLMTGDSATSASTSFWVSGTSTSCGGGGGSIGASASVNIATAAMVNLLRWEQKQLTMNFT
jgi:hypothetical protein